MTKKIRKIQAFTKYKPEMQEAFLSLEQEYDENGNLTLVKDYNQNLELLSSIEISYNENNKPVKEISNQIEDGICEKKFMEYDESGNLLSQKIEYFEGAYSIKKYNYDKELGTVEIITYDEDDVPEEKVVIQLDSKKRIVSQSNFDDRNKLVDKVEHIYDAEKDLLIEKLEYNKKNKLEKRNIYFYDDNKNFLGIKVENRKSKLLDWIKMEYDENGKIICQKTASGAVVNFEHSSTEDKITTKEIQYDPSGNIANEITTTKDIEGNVILEQSIDKEVMYKYEYF